MIAATTVTLGKRQNQLTQQCEQAQNNPNFTLVGTKSPGLTWQEQEQQDVLAEGSRLNHPWDQGKIDDNQSLLPLQED